MFNDLEEEAPSDGCAKRLKLAIGPTGGLTANQSRRIAGGTRSISMASPEPPGGMKITRDDLMAKNGVLRPDKATCVTCPAILLSGGTSNDSSGAASDAAEEIGGRGTPWLVAFGPSRSASSHVGNGAVNGSRMRITSQIAEILESTMCRRHYKISTRQPSPAVENFAVFTSENEPCEAWRVQRAFKNDIYVCDWTAGDFLVSF
jgi:hypothetical protein